jgi:hypothetical protein
LLKPSELTPATSALLHELASEAFAADEFSVVLGDASVGQAFAGTPFDHLFFTGIHGCRPRRRPRGRREPHSGHAGARLASRPR